MESERRRFLATTAALGLGTLFTAATQIRADDKVKQGKEEIWRYRRPA
jgi:hypothetical protein